MLIMIFNSHIFTLDVKQFIKALRCCLLKSGGYVTISIKEELADWIDTDVIAEHILDEMKEQGDGITLKYVKKVWLDVLLNELHDAIKNATTTVRSL